MSMANVILVRCLYEAFGRHENSRIVNAIAKDAEWRVVARENPGLSGRRAASDCVTSRQCMREFVPREIVPAGNRVFVLGTHRLAGGHHGSRAESGWIHVFTFDGGKVTAFCEFSDTAPLAESRDLRGGQALA